MWNYDHRHKTTDDSQKAEDGGCGVVIQLCGGQQDKEALEFLGFPGRHVPYFSPSP
jgi:hypothetical protein